MDEPPVTALGIRVKSGWASAVLVGVDAGQPVYLHRSSLLLSDPAVPESSQPYHRGFGRLQKDADVIRRLTRVVYTAARKSLKAVARECATLGHPPQNVALVVGSTIDPRTVGNEHIRAHAYEARLFRTSLERAAASAGVAWAVYRERDLKGLSTDVLGAGAMATVAAMGQQAGRPWRGDEKLAALAAWMVCVQGTSGARDSTAPQVRPPSRSTAN